MRAPFLLALLVLAASPALADPAADVATKVGRYADRIERCYLDRATTSGTGAVSVELTVARSGEVSLIAIRAPGLATKTGIAVSGCIVDTLTGLTFSPRAAETTTTLPYYFARAAKRDRARTPRPTAVAARN